jgi:MoaA/NifB/PqqE/SkfB family radical SAM enzyme
MSFLNTVRFTIQRLFTGVHFPLGISVDLTNRCNLNCKHCYFLRQRENSELTDDQIIRRIGELKSEYPSAIHGAWVGGEPLLRKQLLAECTKLFPMNMIVTNGTIELPQLPGSVFNVSVDGTKEYYEQIRGRGHYYQVKENADRGDVHVNVTCVLNRINGSCLDAFVQEWKNTKIRGISFSFYTPQKGITSDPLWLSGTEKDLLIDKIGQLKKEYGDFIINSRSVLNLMRSSVSPDIINHCKSPKAFISIDSSGRLKQPCVMGSNADCSRCGCIVPYELEAVLVRKKLDAIRMAKKFYTS